MSKEVESLIAAVLANDEGAVTAHAAAVNVLAEDGRLPLFVACMKSCVAATTVRLLLKLGAHPDAKGSDDETPLYIAVYNDHREVVRLLLGEKIAIDEVNGPDKETALHVAARLGYIDILITLLNAGASINSTNVRMETPLYVASKAGKHDSVYTLLMHNANVNLTNTDGKSALYIASECEHKNVVILLKADKRYLKEAKAEADTEVRMRPHPLPSNEAIAAVLTEARRRESEVNAVRQTKAAAAGAPAAAPTPLEILPIVIPSNVIRDRDPITGASRGPCRSLEEVGYDEPPQLPPGAVLPPLSEERLGGTTMVVGPDHRPAPQFAPTYGDDTVDYAAGATAHSN